MKNIILLKSTNMSNQIKQSISEEILKRCVTFENEELIFDDIIFTDIKYLSDMLEIQQKINYDNDLVSYYIDKYKIINNFIYNCNHTYSVLYIR